VELDGKVIKLQIVSAVLDAGSGSWCGCFPLLCLDGSLGGLDVSAKQMHAKFKKVFHQQSIVSALSALMQQRK
jgi:hypothetical protein